MVKAVKKLALVYYSVWIRRLTKEIDSLQARANGMILFGNYDLEEMECWRKQLNTMKAKRRQLIKKEKRILSKEYI